MTGLEEGVGHSFVPIIEVKVDHVEALTLLIEVVEHGPMDMANEISSVPGSTGSASALCRASA